MCNVVLYWLLSYKSCLKEFAIPGSNASVAILFIDTVILSGLTHPTDRSQPPPGPSSYSFASNEWDFIKQTLTTWSQSGKKDQWKLVVGHYPGTELVHCV